MMSPEVNGRNEEGPTNANVVRLIETCSVTKNTSLCLSSMMLSEVPEGVLALEHLQHLYLDGNQLKTLPGNFFDCLHNLRWLDLRNNELVSLPSAYIGRHRALRHLLLEGNSLQSLPLELGLVTTLQGLNIAKNPLGFPPAEILQKGVKEILRFCRSMLHMKSLAHSEKSQNGAKGAFDFARDGDVAQLAGGDDDEDGEATVGAASAAASSEVKLLRRRPSTASSVTSEVMGQAAALHAADSRGDVKASKAAIATADGRKQTRRKAARQQPGPLRGGGGLLPSDEQIDEKLQERSRKARDKARNEGVDKLLQRAKNAEALSEFRDKTKTLQRKKEIEKRIKGKLDYVEAVDSAPFDIDPEHVHMISNEERIKEGVRQTHERVRRVLSPSVIRKLEEARMEKEKELQDKLKQHTQAMKERRQKPKGTPQEEMDAAVRELEIAKRLQRELDRRRKDLEYRFKAFAGTGDSQATAAGTRVK